MVVVGWLDGRLLLVRVLEWWFPWLPLVAVWWLLCLRLFADLGLADLYGRGYWLCLLVYDVAARIWCSMLAVCADGLTHRTSEWRLVRVPLQFAGALRKVLLLLHGVGARCERLMFPSVTSAPVYTGRPLLFTLSVRYMLSKDEWLYTGVLVSQLSPLTLLHLYFTAFTRSFMPLYK